MITPSYYLRHLKSIHRRLVFSIGKELIVKQVFIFSRQLRDMITFPTKDKREIVAVYQNNVVQYNMARKTSTSLLKDISFAPTTLTANYGYLAVGGQRSQVIIRQLTSNW